MDTQLPKALFAYRTAVHETTGFTSFHLTFPRSPQLPVDIMLDQTLPAKLRSYPQFVQEARKQMAASCNIAQQHLQVQHLCNKKLHDKDNTAVPYIIVDKTGEVNDKIPLIGSTQTFVVYRNSATHHRQTLILKISTHTHTHTPL